VETETRAGERVRRVDLRQNKKRRGRRETGEPCLGEFESALAIRCLVEEACEAL